MVSNINSTIVQASDSTQSSYMDWEMDGFLNLFRLDEARSQIPSSYRLYHTNKRSVSMMATIGDEAHLGKDLSGLLFVNDMSRPTVHVPNDNKGRKFEVDGKAVSFNKSQMEKIQEAIDEDYAKWVDTSNSVSTAEQKRIEQYGNVIGYMNLFLYGTVDSKLILTRVPGSKALRDGISKDRRTYSEQRHLRKGDELVGEKVLCTFNWNDASKNSHIESMDDYSHLLGL